MKSPALLQSITNSVLFFLIQLTAAAMIFPLPEPYDHNYNLWTSQDTVAKGYPQAVLLDGGAPRFQATPVAPQYLVTAGHLLENFSEVVFNGVTNQIEGYLMPGGVPYEDTMLIKIKSGKFPTYARLAPTVPKVGDVTICFGSGWSAGAPVRDFFGNLRGWENSTANKGYRWGLGRISAVGEKFSSTSIFWDWLPNDPIIGNSACIFTVGDSGGGMFNKSTRDFIGVIRTTVPSGPFNVQPSTNWATCTYAYLFNTNNLYKCGSTNLAPALSKMEHRVMSSAERTWILNSVSPAIRLNAGGPSTSNWQNWNSGYSLSGWPVIDITAVTNPAPAEIYNSVNYITAKCPQRSLSYTATNLLRTETYKIRLHFSGWPYAKGQVFQDIRINGSMLRSNFDPSELGINKATLVEVLSVRPDADDKISIEITPHPGSIGKAFISGIEITVND